MVSAEIWTCEDKNSVVRFDILETALTIVADENSALIKTSFSRFLQFSIITFKMVSCEPGQFRVALVMPWRPPFREYRIQDLMNSGLTRGGLTCSGQ